LRIKEQETRLNLHEHDDDDEYDDKNCMNNKERLMFKTSIRHDELN